MEISDNILNKLVDIAKSEIDKSTRSTGNKEDLPFKYLGEDGKITLRLLYNPKGGIIQRKISRHTINDKTKIPCLRSYGQDCPICDAINEIEAVKGKEAGAFRKYGYKSRGICIGIPVDKQGYGDMDLNRPTIIMYPITVYNMLNDLIVETGADLGQVVAQNEGIPITLSKQGVGPSSYHVSLTPFKKCVIYDTLDGNEKFDELLNNLPDLTSMFAPATPNEEMYEKARAAADAIKQEMLNGTVINPNETFTIPAPQQSQSPVSILESVSITQNTGTPTSTTPASNNVPQSVSLGDNVTPSSVNTASTNVPTCFGQHSRDAQKCSLCASEIECMRTAPQEGE